MKNDVQIIFTDFDGTLADKNNLISSTNRATLAKLGQSGIVRVIATGRSPYTLRKVIEDDFPVDYIIFSSGAGILDWNRKEMLMKKNFEPELIQKAIQIFENEQLDFMLHKAIPENHYLVYKKFSSDNSDFNKRIKIYGQLAKTFKAESNGFSEYSQLLAIFPKNKKHLIKKVTLQFDFASCIIASSPFDHVSMWLEIFPKGVSKGLAAQFLCDKLSIDKKHTFSVGNDFNDIHLLDWTHHSYVVNNAPTSLKQKYIVADENNNSGFSHALRLAEII